ncbi:MAG: EcsC family protein [Clostridiales Family XIII bacterium]|jgi:hypothetical protein|nr:EcsC family protein [Clostridiales Family XIII bacterium]
MNLYERKVNDDLDKWRKEMQKKANLLESASKGVQTKTQKLIPQKVQDTISTTMSGMVKTVMFGSGLTTIHEDTSDLSLSESDFLALQQFKSYKKSAVVSGAGIGAGGLILGLADLPSLIAIKIKFLFDCAKLYGYDIDEPSERLFILYVFQMAFSSRAHRLTVYEIIENWDDHHPDVVDWEKFQIEYRDYLDTAKLLQLVPVIGSAVGAASNNYLMDRLLVNAMNSYRLRRLRIR